MRIVYCDKTVVEKLLDLLGEAHRAKKHIDRIFVTEDEWRELEFLIHPIYFNRDGGFYNSSFGKVRIEKE